jgi:hypothetical protein
MLADDCTEEQIEAYEQEFERSLSCVQWYSVRSNR